MLDVDDEFTVGHLMQLLLTDWATFSLKFGTFVTWTDVRLQDSLTSINLNLMALNICQMMGKNVFDCGFCCVKS